MHRTLRRVTTATIAVTTATILTACGGNNNEQTDSQQEVTTTQAQGGQEELSAAPYFDSDQEILEELGNDGCGPKFEKKATEIIGWFVQKNSPEEAVQKWYDQGSIEFNSGRVNGGLMSCDITVKNATITDTPGGDLTEFTVQVVGLPAESNEIDGTPVEQLRAAAQAGSDVKSSPLDKVEAFESLGQLETLGREALTFISTNGMESAAYSTSEAKRYWLFAHNDDSYFAWETNLPATKEVTENARQGRGWAVVTTSDTQKDNGHPQKTAAGQLAFAFTQFLNLNTDESDSYNIKSKVS